MLYLLKKLKHIDSYGESNLSMFYLKFYCPWKLCPLLPILYGRNKSVQNAWSCHKLHRFIDFPTPSANMNFFFLYKSLLWNCLAVYFNVSKENILFYLCELHCILLVPFGWFLLFYSITFLDCALSVQSLLY